MFKRKKKSPSAKDINEMAKKSDASSLSSQSYSSLPKSLYSGGDKAQGHHTPTRSTTLNLSGSASSQNIGEPQSPLDLPMETLQSITAAYSFSKNYTGDNSLSSKVQNRSPYQSPVHSSYSPNSKAATRHRSLEKGEFSGLFCDDPSLERQFERLQMMRPTTQHSDISASNTMPVSRGERRTASMNYSRERSQEREQYPHMGARSLERDHYFHANNRSRSTDRHSEMQSQLQQSQEQYRNLSRDSLILELQSQITDLNKDCAKLQQELDSTKDKLSSTMNSIKTFWSPELKKERSLRKEESAKHSLLNEQYKATQAELKKQTSAIRELESKQQATQRSLDTVPKDDYDTLKHDIFDQQKEIKILRKTVDEMVLRLETQKQTLVARDGSIKKLLEMLHSKGVPVDRVEETHRELEHCKIQQIEDASKLSTLQKTIDEREKEITELKEASSKLRDEVEQAQVQLKQQPASAHTMQAIMEAKDSRISALEKELQALEDKLHTLGAEGTLDKDSSLKKDLTPGREKALKAEIETLKTEVQSKENEIVGLKMKWDTLTNQQSEHQHYINVLKDQIKSKEEQASMFQADIDDLRDRLREKDKVIDKKSQQAQSLTVEKRKLELESAEVRDSLDIKGRKVDVLQRKIENLEDLLTEKEDQITQIKTLSMARETSDSAISIMEESLSDKDRQIDRLKEQRDVMELEHQQECEELTANNQTIKTQLDALQNELTDKTTELCELREEVSEMKASRHKSDSRVRQLEVTICEKDSEISRITTDLEQLKASCSYYASDSVIEEQLDHLLCHIELKVARSNGASDSVTEEQLDHLSSQVEQCQAEMKSAQTEVDRLLEILKETENEKNEKETQIKELQDTVAAYKQKFGTLKRQNLSEKKRNANLLEEARRREEDVSTDADQLKGSVKEKEGRIEELEEALRESVKITAEREMLLMEQKMQIDNSQSKIEELQSELLVTKTTAKDYGTKLSSYVKQLEDKDTKLKRMNSERHKHLEEVFEMKQEALQAALCEKDANIALLEMTSTKKQRNVEEIEKLNKEKDKLNQQLKELVQNRSRYMQERSKGAKKSRQKSQERTSDPKIDSKLDTKLDIKADTESDGKTDTKSDVKLDVKSDTSVKEVKCTSDCQQVPITEPPAESTDS